jgi:glycolate oxidase FAD binding subunit
VDLNGRAAEIERPTPPACGCLGVFRVGPGAWGMRDLAIERPSTAAEAAEALRALAAAHERVWIVGGGSRLAACPPLPVEAAVVATDRLSGIVAVEPGDLTLTVQGGMQLVMVHEVLHDLGLELPGSHFGFGGGTVGGALATGLADARRGRGGPLRDRILGMEIATTDGRVTKSGGRVVKNVAGYDVGRLIAGSHGALALITEVTLRLAPRPETHAPFERGFADAAEAVRAAVEIARDAPAVGIAAVIAGGGGAGGATLAWVHEGEHEAVAAGVAWSEARFGAREPHDDAAHGAPVGARLLLSALEHVCPERTNALVRGNVRPSRLPDLVAAITAGAPLLWGVHAGTGAVLVRHDLASAPGRGAAHAAAAAIEAAGGTWRAQGAWRADDLPSGAPWGGIDAAPELYARVKAAFDATGRLGPPAFGGAARPTAATGARA